MRLTKEVTTQDGTFTLYSYDGLNWSMSPSDARKRASAGINFHGKPYAQKIAKEAASTANPGEKIIKESEKWQKLVPKNSRVLPVLLPVNTHASPILGKAKGKNQKYRKNLKPRKEKPRTFRRHAPGLYGIGMVPQGAHFHRCHGRRYACGCDTPYLRRPCGGTHCLREVKED